MLLFESLIGALWAIVTVLALMVKQGVQYVSAVPCLENKESMSKRRETAGLLFTLTERETERESKMERGERLF